MSDRIDLAQVCRHFSGHAEDYDRYAIVQKQVARHLVQSLPGPPEDEPLQVLDVGTGTGEVLLNYRQRFGCRDRLVGSDLSPAMCAVAGQRIPGIETRVADAQALPFVSTSFDRVLSSSVYQWMNDLPAAFDEAGRVLKPGGLFAFALYGERTLHELKTAFRMALGTLSPGQTDYTQTFPGMDQVRAALSSDGWRGITLWQTEEVEWHPDPGTMLRRLKKIGAHNASSQRPSGLPPRALVQTMLAQYQQRFGDARGIPATYEVLYGHAVRC